MPMSYVDRLMQAKPGDTLFWPALSSTTLDPAISRHYAEQPADEGRGNVLFRIEDVLEGIRLEDVSQYPDEREFLLPLFSELEVVTVHRELPKTIVCKFKGSLMPADFEKEVENDLKRAEAELLEHGRGALRQKEQREAVPSGAYPPNPAEGWRKRRSP